MERVLKITMKGSKEVLDRVEGYIESVLSRNKDSTYRKCLKDFEIERVK